MVIPVDTFADGYQSTVPAGGFAAGATTIAPTAVTGAPSANPTLTPPTQFRVVLQSASYPVGGTREIVTVTDSRTSSWTCTALVHSYVAGDIVAAVVTQAALAGKLTAGNNLGDLDDPRTARGNLGLLRVSGGSVAPTSPQVDDLWFDDGSPSAGAGQYLPYAFNQRGAWAPSTAYAIGDMAIDPTGNYVVPKAAHTSGAVYTAANWNIIVPAQNYGRELTGAESNADFNMAGLTGWQDVPSLTGTIPAGIPFIAHLTGLVAAVQGTAAQGSIVGVQMRLVDSTAANVYAFAWRQFDYSAASGQTFWQSIAGFRRGVALAVSTPVKVQASAGTVTGQGNIGFFPASGGGGEPTTFTVLGR